MMVRFKMDLRIFCVLLISAVVKFSSCEVDTQNVMKIRPTESADLGQNDTTTDQSQEITNNTTTDDTNPANYSSSQFIPHDLQIVADSLTALNEDGACFKDSKKVLDSITKKERWALKMFDASSKFPVGILHGSFYQMGNYDECVDAKEPATGSSSTTSVQGQYCLADVELFHNKEHNSSSRSFGTAKSRMSFNNSTIYWGVCAPSSCTPEEVAKVVKEFFILATDYPDLFVTLNPAKCHIENAKPVTVMEIIYGCVIGTVLIFIVFATFFHYIVIRKRKSSFAYNVDTLRASNSNTFKEVVVCFSIIRNVGKFLKTKPSDLNLECICGVRFLSMAFIIAGHSLLFMIGGPVQNTDFMEKESLNPINAIFFNSPLLVDTFLLISGFLMCYLFLLELDKRRGQVNILVLYVARYIRLTPAYAVVIGLYCCLLPRLGDGPLWNSKAGLEQERCLNSWWVNLLYVNNYFKTDDICMFQSWYLAVDYHLFIIAPFVIYPLWKMNKIGKVILGTITTVTILVPFWITFRERLDPTLLAFAPEIFDISSNFYFVNAYIKTHMRASSYFLGLVFGYVIYKLQTSGTKIPRLVLWCGWFTSAICGILAMHSITIFYLPHHEYNVFESSIFSSLHRVAWCVSIGWILVVCITDNAGLVNAFLSWKPFIPLSRLTYCAYLVNGFIEIYGVGTLRTGIFMSKYELTCRTLAHGLLTLSAAFVLCILFESPIHGLEKILLRKVSSNNTHNSRDKGISRSTTTEQLDDDTI